MKHGNCLSQQWHTPSITSGSWLLVQTFVITEQLKWKAENTGRHEFLRNISRNISRFGKRADLKLGEVSYSFIFYNVTIS